jgi:hypothetical protein
MRLRKSSGRASAANSTDGAPTSSPTAWTDASPNASSAFAMNSPIVCGANRSSRASDCPKPGRSIASTSNCFVSPAHTGANAKMLSGHGLTNTTFSSPLPFVA